MVVFAMLLATGTGAAGADIAAVPVDCEDTGPGDGCCDDDIRFGLVFELLFDCLQPGTLRPLFPLPGAAAS